ncbi:hypothetical protein [Streptomyces sp. HPF1205]|uniref:hypothetical protein n=1 Tax=Streptomyces sp. HPF1205 TaxID=2873262 RepID=UPI001CEC9CAE|nr:hypothetical protein [Streptomyces sp. HPF1205]
MTEPAPRFTPEAASERDRAGAAAGGRAGVPPYRAQAVWSDGQWHLAVESLNDHPDRGEVDSVVVTLAAGRPDGGRPPAEVDDKLRECGFDRQGEWARHGDGWSAQCVQSDSRAAPAPITQRRRGAS